LKEPLALISDLEVVVAGAGTDSGGEVVWYRGFGGVDEAFRSAAKPSVRLDVELLCD